MSEFFTPESIRSLRELELAIQLSQDLHDSYDDPYAEIDYDEED